MKKLILFLLIFLLSISVYADIRDYDNYNGSTIFNITDYNVVSAVSFIGDGSALTGVSGSGGGNSTQEIIDAVNGTALNSTNFFGYLWSSVVSKPFTTVSSIYFSIVGDELTLNETKLNITIDARDSNTHVEANGSYLYNDSTFITFNESKLNSTASAIFLNSLPINTTQVNISQLPGAKVMNLQGLLDGTSSAGTFVGGVVTNGGAGTVNISEWNGSLRATSDLTSTLYSVTIPAINGFNVTNNSFNYIYADYNGGSPIFTTSLTPIDDIYSNTIIAGVYRGGTGLHITDGKFYTSNFQSAWGTRSAFTEGIIRETGGVTSETGTRNIAITTGTWWLAVNQYITLATDTSASGTFDYLYKDGVGGFVKVDGQTQIDNLQYDDGTGTLATLATAKYGVHWVYQEMDNDVFVMYGEGSYNLIQAEVATPPTTLPGNINPFHAVLIAKIIIQESDTSFTSVQNPFEQAFTLGSAQNHGDLAGLLNDDHTQYLLVDGTRNATNISITNFLCMGGLCINSLSVLNQTSEVNAVNASLQILDTREAANNATQASQILTLDTRQSSDNTTQSNQIFTLNTRESANNVTQAALITSNTNNIATLDTRQSADNTTQAAQIAAINGNVNSTSWNRSGTNVILATGSDNVGIGTSSPSNKLHVNSSTTDIVALFESSDAASDIILKDSTDQTRIRNTGGEFLVLTNADTNVAIQTSSGNVLFNAGNVGIGDETSPISELHVSDTGADSIIAIENTGNGFTSGLAFIRERLSGTGVIGGCIGMDSDTTTNNPTIVMDVDSSVSCGQTFGAQQRFSINANGNAFFGNLNVGIGTSSPTEVLDVIGQMKLGTAEVVTPNLNSDDLEIHNSASWVGISLLSDTGHLIDFGNSTDDNNGRIQYSSDVMSFRVDGNLERFRIAPTTVVVNELGSDVDFRVEGDTDANLLFTDASTDRVGIGTASPSYELHIAGELNIQDTVSNVPLRIHRDIAGDFTQAFMKFQMDNDVGSVTDYADIVWKINDETDTTEDGQLRFRVMEAGSLADNVLVFTGSNVGIGTATPNQKLEVNGNILLQDDDKSCYGATDCTEGQIFWNSTSSELTIVVS